ncbi:TIR domain-containing protein [Aquimarina rhabdastrellae]
MAKRVFFSFHYQDVIDFRANVVRNHWVTKNSRNLAGFFDASIWETAKKTSDLAIKRLINKELKNTSNTCILIGTNTFNRRWVRYEIFKSIKKGNNLFGVHINRIRDKNGIIKDLGSSPFDFLGFEYSSDGKTIKPIEFKIKKWGYSRDMKPIKLHKTPHKSYWGKSFALSKWYKDYCWVDDDGFNNFHKWVK